MKIFHLFPLFIFTFTANFSHGFEFRFGASSKEIPQWVANPESDDAEYIYGVGEGSSLTKAVQSALNNISGKLATVVSGNVSSETIENQGKVSGYFSEQVKTRTLDTRLSNYEVVKSVAQDDVYYALVKMSRSAFVKDTSARLKIIDDRLNNRIAQASKISRLQHYLALNEVQPDIEEATALVLLLQAAAPGFDSGKYLPAYQGYQSGMNELLFQLRFRVDAEPKISAIADMVARLLGSEKLSTTTGRGPADAVLKITGQLQNSFLFSEYTTQLRIRIQVSDVSGRNINTGEYVVAGSSMTNYDASRITATNILEQKLQDEGVFALLGLQKPM